MMSDENYCDGFICDMDYHLHIFCLFKGIVTAKQCMDCRKEKSLTRKVIDNYISELKGENNG